MRVDNIKLKIGESLDVLKQRACKIAKISVDKVKHFEILKKSIDARDKGNVHFVYSVEVSSSLPVLPTICVKNYKKPSDTVLVVGSGPAGLFCALILARQGLNPVVIERGQDVSKRAEIIKQFETQRVLDEECNIQYGEGGAGTFSDGKLNTGVKSEYKSFVLSEFVKHGAPECILYDAKPHIGSDKLPSVVKSIREEIISLGGIFKFGAKLTGAEKNNGKITTAIINGNERIAVSEIILAIGHSARDTYENLFNTGFFMEEKDCAIGLRIEHLQEDINKSQYGKFYREKSLGSADYKLTSNVLDRGVFTFCMCPGGYVTAATSENGAVVTNGMSNFLRNNVNANSAVVVQVRKSDYPEGVLGGIEYLRSFERKAYIAGGSNYNAPVQLVGDFINGRESKSFERIKPTYPIGTTFARLDKLLPENVVKPLQAGIKDMDRRLRGFAVSDAVLTGVETRTSSPVRIVRGEKLCSLNFENAYPCGETGYAGGIMSAALDGIKVANAILQKYEI